jgi:hypothetical protein
MENNVGQIILRQLGGNRFITMTGAKNFLTGGKDLTFRIPGNITKNGVNVVKIVLDPSDTYTVTFSKLRGIKLTPVSTHEDVYCDNLRDVFETNTGLRTSL